MAVGSFSAGLSGLNANAKALSVVGNNLANLNTVAYKTSSVNFSDLVSHTIMPLSESPAWAVELTPSSTCFVPCSIRYNRGFCATLNALNHLSDLLGCYRSALCQFAHLVSNNCDACSPLSGAGGFNGGIQRQQVGLVAASGGSGLRHWRGRFLV